MKNYFELFDLPIDLFPDMEALKAAYYRLSKQYHPDINRSNAPEDYMKTLEMSGNVNAGYKILKDPTSRLKYILELHDHLPEENEQLPPEFLMEMMELNESVMEADSEEKRESVRKQIAEEIDKIQRNLEDVWSNVESGTPNTAQLDDLKSSYYKQKYLLRIRENLDNFAAL